MIVSGISEIHERVFNLNQLLNKIHIQTVERCNSNNLVLNTIRNIPETDIKIETDEVLLVKIFSHLLDNAIKFTKEGEISVNFSNRADAYLFSVSDTGIGIFQNSLSQIFDIFTQADTSSSRNYEGSGLGLSIAKGFVKQLGGEIWVESESGRGSTFFFTIPKKLKNIENMDTVANPEKASPPKQHTILVAEDDESNYKYIEIVLKKSDFKVVRASNGFETIEICKNNPEISLVLTDMKMPGMDGLEATREIRKFLPHLPIVALSAFISIQDRNTALEAGCNDYIVKPVNKTKLIETIVKML